MRGAIQSLPSSSRSPFLPWVVLPHEMNPKNFPKKLISKTSCLRITVPENLDLALEGLIRKVLKEQPKVDDIYAFAADYFDTLLKIREKAGTKFTASQICPFHNDEDAHEMIKLANSFAKPVKTETPEVEKTKTDAKTRRKEFSQAAGKTEKKVVEKEPATVKEKHETTEEKKEKQNEKLIETKPERPKTLELEPKTEDVGEDEEFLKSDPIKVLVEKELMDAEKLQSKELKNKGENETNVDETEKPEESAPNKEFCTVVDEDHLKTENGKSEVTTTKDENSEQRDVLNDEELTKEGDEKKKDEHTNSEINTTEEQESKDVVTEVTEANKSNETEEIKQDLGDEAIDKVEDVKTEFEKDNPEMEIKEVNTKPVEEVKKEIQKAPNEDKAIEEIKQGLGNNTKDKGEVVKTEIQNDNVEIEVKDEDVKPAERVEKEIQKSNDKVKEDSEVGEITETDQDHKKVEETNEAENKQEVNLESQTKTDQTAEEIKLEDAPALEIKSQDASVLESITEENINTDELCTVVDVLSIKPPKIEAESAKEQAAAPEKESEKSEQKEPPSEKDIEEKEAKTEEIECNEVEVKIKTEVPAETEGVQTSSFGKDIESTEADKQYESSNSETPENQEESKLEVKSDKHENLNEQTETEDKKLVEETPEEQIEIKSEENKQVPPEEKKIIDEVKEENETKETEEKKDEVQIKEEKTVNTIEESENEVKGTTEVEDKNEGKPVENEEQSNIPGITTDVEAESVADTTGTEAKLSDGDVKPLESSVIENEKSETAENKTKPEEIMSKEDNASTETLEENSKPENEEKPSEEVTKVKEEETKIEEEGQNEKTKKEVEDKVELTEKEKTTEEEKEKDEGVIEEHQIKKREIEDDTKEESVKPANGLEEPQKVETNTGEPETDKTPEEDEPCTVVDAQHVIKVEDADEHSEDVPQPEGVQIKTIQTHLYDTLKVPEEVTKEYKVHAVGDNGGSLLNVVPSLLPSPQAIETPRTPLDLSKEMDLEDSLLTPSSNYSLNLSELSFQTINEMFLENEKQYSSMEKEEKKYVTKPGERCGDEGNVVKQEVEEIIHKTVVPTTIGATPVAPREDAEINAEENTEERRTKQEASMESVADSSNEGRSIDSDTPIISVEVKTVIETQVLDEEDENKGDWDVEIKIEASTNVPEGVVIELEEKREANTEVQQNEPTNSETAPEDSQSQKKETLQTSSGESESTISSTATEIKRTDSTKRHFSSTRTLLSTRSLDLDKRNPLLKTRSLSSFRQGVTDFEVWNAIEKELEEAATKIQSNFRGYKTRKKLQRENAVQITTEESSCSTTPVELDQESESEQGPEPEGGRQWTTGEFHDTIVLPEYPR